MKYRPEIDGLRTLAVSSVLLFHLDKNYFPGGFLGVDMFFTISGFLITSIILNKLDDDSFVISTFFQRRIARISPLFFLVMSLTLLSASIIYEEKDFASSGANALAASLSVTNIKLLFQGSYFEISEDAQPFLHYWSLSLEEQFYLIFPLLMIYIYKINSNQPHKKRKITFKYLSVCFTLSLIFYLYLVDTRPNYAFYLLPSRAWELLAGSLLAIYNFKFIPKWAVILQTLGLYLIFISCFLIQPESKYFEYANFIVVLGTILLLINTTKTTFINQILSNRTIVYIGKLSFSLYLWHWPVFSFVDYNFFLESTAYRTFLKIIITLVLSLLSYHFIEIKCRKILNKPQLKTQVFVGFISLTFAFSYLGYHIRSENYFSSQLEMVKYGGVEFNSEYKKSITVIGDSNGSMYRSVFKDISNKLGYRLNMLTVDGKDPFQGQFKTDSLEFLRKNKPEYVIYVTLWSRKKKHAFTFLEEYLSNLALDSKVILITQIPILPINASREEIRKHGLKQFHEDNEHEINRKKVNLDILKFKSENIYIIDVDKYFLNINGSINFLSNDNHLLYQDSTHLSRSGAQKIKTELTNLILD
ncbi:acyltransferase family protein [Lentisphaera marina]|uniref:acyltransferase family protein n=1 Tax=Lentisphaera marina TaxID=1111041 RepID=UPI002367135E|nr:acyltransferase family protein [Lentisphaera marina]MDD7986907.1 acyltransferase family protein [Lentisphaera marina]